MSNRDISIEINMQLDTYVTITLRDKKQFKIDNKIILEKAEFFTKKAKKYRGRLDNSPYNSIINLKNIVFSVTYSFPNSRLAKKFIKTISNKEDN